MGQCEDSDCKDEATEVVVIMKLKDRETIGQIHLCSGCRIRMLGEFEADICEREQ